jgi:energy-coupling factor transporter transmembrane protein EcfT
MTRLRWLLMAVILVITLALSFFMRDLVYDMVIVPLAYLFWLVKYYYTAIPQLFLWIVFLIVLFVTVAWNFIPQARPSRRKEHFHRPPDGQVETLAAWIRNSRKGNYFKWQLANRLGRISRKLKEISRQRQDSEPGREAVENYFDAGLNKSFVDFTTPRSRFDQPASTPLDLDPKDAVDFLESQMELKSDRYS